MSAEILTATKPFGHVFDERRSPQPAGFGCCICGFFVKKLDESVKRLVCGHVTYPVLP